MLIGAEVLCHACGEGVWCWGNDDEGGGEWATEGREEVLAENLVLLERCWVFGAWARMKCAGGVGGGAYGVGFWRSRRCASGLFLPRRVAALTGTRTVQRGGTEGGQRWWRRRRAARGDGCLAP